MSYELPPKEQARMHKIETVIMIVFGTLIVATIVAVTFSKFRPLPQPSNLPRVEQPPASRGLPGLPPARQ